LIKILPINVVCHAMLRLGSEQSFSRASLEAAVRDVVVALAPHSARFRGFAASDAAAEIVRRARQSQLSFERFSAERLPLYRLYADYVQHCMPASA